MVGRTNDQTLVQELIAQYEEVAAKQGKPELRVHVLKEPLSATILATLQALVPDAKVTPSTDAKQLVIVARTEDHATIKTTLDQIESSADAADDRQLEVYQVEGMTAAGLQTLLQPLVVNSSITVDAVQDRLIVWGPPDEQAAFLEGGG